MISVREANVFNFESAIIGMRNPMNSWEKSDSQWKWVENPLDENVKNPDRCRIYIIGHNDLELMQKLIHAGSPHDKFMRQILCSMQIEAPIYWWKEMDTYKVATVANSTSTMHKIHSKPIEISDFSIDFPKVQSDKYRVTTAITDMINTLEWLRKKYLETKDQIPKDNPYWRSLIQLLPESYNQTRMWTANYETLRNIYKWRKDHKLIEWREFCKVITDNNVFPYGKELIAYGLD